MATISPPTGPEGATVLAALRKRKVNGGSSDDDDDDATLGRGEEGGQHSDRPGKYKRAPAPALAAATAPAAADSTAPPPLAALGDDGVAAQPECDGSPPRLTPIARRMLNDASGLIATLREIAAPAVADNATGRPNDNDAVGGVVGVPPSDRATTLFRNTAGLLLPASAGAGGGDRLGFTLVQPSIVIDDAFAAQQFARLMAGRLVLHRGRVWVFDSTRGCWTHEPALLERIVTNLGRALKFAHEPVGGRPPSS